MRWLISTIAVLLALTVIAVAAVGEVPPSERSPIAIDASSDIAPPILSDRRTEAKFPKEAPGVIDALASLNRYVNGAIEPVSDMEQYGVGELWVMFPASGRGDCEDYALTKLGLLSKAGFPIVAYARIRGVVVHLRNGNDDGHAILELRLPHGSIAFLDNRFDRLMTRNELERAGYRFFDW